MDYEEESFINNNNMSRENHRGKRVGQLYLAPALFLSIVK